jgi:hypothetical protein
MGQVYRGHIEPRLPLRNTQGGYYSVTSRHGAGRAGWVGGWVDSRRRKAVRCGPHGTSWRMQLPTPSASSTCKSHLLAVVVLAGLGLVALACNDGVAVAGNTCV